ncbi:MAG: ABC transporter ATP-binding protein [Desulfatitalea sp.]
MTYSTSPHNPDTLSEREPEPALQISGLTQIYDGAAKPALQALDLTVQYGEIFGLLGPNGAGKTTAISVMSTLLAPTSGCVRICGLDVLHDPQKVRRHIGVVPQDIALFDTLSASENLTYFGRLYGLKGDALKVAVRMGLEVAGLTERSREYVKNFSGGMKRRLNMAIGILHQPRILFLDEPTVGIDAQSRNRILEKLLGLNAQGVTMIYTTHYMEEAQRLCRRLAIIDQGAVVAQGYTQQLIQAHPECKDLDALFLKLTGHQLRD